MNAIELLKKDHQAVTKLFQRFSAGGRDRESVAQKICDELTVHARIEEEVFYPAVRETGDQELQRQVEESLQEHGRMKEQIRMVEAEEGGMEAQMTALQQDVEHHVEEEEGEMFPRLQETMDDDRLSELGRELKSLKERYARGGKTSTATREGGRGRQAGRQGRNAAGRSKARTTRTRGRAKSQGRRTRTKTAGKASARRRTKAGSGATASSRKRARGGRGR